MTVRWCVDPIRPEPASLAEAGAALRRGQLVAFPTETVYGLGGNALDAAAVAAIYAAKGRPADNPLIVHVVDEASARAITAAWPETAARLAEAFWPGPLTLVLPRSPALPGAVTAGLDAVGVRAPAHPVAQALLTEATVPVAAPSANRANHISPTTADHVAKSLGDRVNGIVDAGPCPIGLESTVLSLVGPPTLLRRGHVSLEALQAVVGDVVVAPAVSHGPRTSPGRSPRHYAPDTPLHVVGSAAWERTLGSFEGRVGTITLERPGDHRLTADPSRYAAGLYAALHALDGLCEAILVEAPPDEAAWATVWDRLRRAATAPSG